MLLFTLVRFAWAISECRKDPDAIREKLLSFIFNVTPARQAGILPAVGHDVQFEPIASSGEGRQPQQLRVKTAILERVSAAGTAMLSPSRVCVPMRAFQTLQGIIYAETHEGEGFNTTHLELLTGIAAVAAIAMEHAQLVQVLEIQNSLMREDLELRSDIIGNSKAPFHQAFPSFQHFDIPQVRDARPGAQVSLSLIAINRCLGI